MDTESYCAECQSVQSRGKFCEECGGELQLRKKGSNPQPQQQFSSPAPHQPLYQGAKGEVPLYMSDVETPEKAKNSRITTELNVNRFDGDALKVEEDRISRVVERSQEGAFYAPTTVTRKAFPQREMTGEEEMAMLRERRKQLEQKMRAEGKLK